MRERDYSVDGIHCAGCEAGVRWALSSIPGVVAVDPDREEGRVRVTGSDDAFEPDVVAGVLETMGLPAHVVKEQAGPGRPRVSAAASGTGAGTGRQASRKDAPVPMRSVGLGAVVVAALAGTAASSVLGVPALEGAALFALAALAGLASLLSPCAFPLLGMTVRQRRQHAGKRRGRIWVGGPFVLGLVASLLLGGIVIGALAAVFTTGFTTPTGIILRTLAAGAVVVFGVAMTDALLVSLPHVTVSLPRLDADAEDGPGRPSADTSALLGFVYLGASFGCAGPAVISLGMYALVAAGFAGTVAAFAVAAIASAVTAFVVSGAENATLTAVNAATPRVKRGSGWVVTGVGGGLLVFVSLGRVILGSVGG